MAISELVDRMARAVKRRAGVRLSKNQTLEVFNELNGGVRIDKDDYQDLCDRAACASYAITTKRCGLCKRIAVDGYICIHCGGDDSIPREETANG